jgi:hypothetical protein
MNLEQAKNILFHTHISCLAAGERAHGYVLQSGPGVGKTDSIFQLAEQLARYLNMPVGLRIQMIAEITGPDMRGFMIPVKREGSIIPMTVFSTPPWYPDNTNIFVFEPNPDGSVTMHAPGEWQGPLPVVGILFLDEWGQGDEDVRKPGASLIHQGNVGTCELPMGWRVVAAQNRPSDRSGVQRELMHIVNRRCLLDIDPDLATWLNWADDQPDGKRPHHLTRTFARKEPGIVFRPTLPDTADPYCTARSLCAMDLDIRVLRSEEDKLRDKLPMSELARELCAGFIGKPAAAQFFTHLRFADELPDLQDILDTPAEAKVPEGKDAQMIVAYMLADVVTEDTASPVFKYVTRLSREMQILAVGVMTGKSDIAVEDQAKSLRQVERTKALVVLPEYTQWLLRHKDVLLASQM